MSCLPGKAACFSWGRGREDCLRSSLCPLPVEPSRVILENWGFKRKKESLGALKCSKASEKRNIQANFQTAFCKPIGCLLQSIFCTESWRNKRREFHTYGSDGGLYKSFGEGTLRERWARTRALAREGVAGILSLIFGTGLRWVDILQPVLEWILGLKEDLWLHYANRPATQGTLITHWMSVHEVSALPEWPQLSPHAGLWPLYLGLGYPAAWLL